METDSAKCSFCGRPQRLVLYLVKGPRGNNICDLCVLEARSRSETVDTGPWGSQCSFCERSADDVNIMLMSDTAAICRDCAENCGNTIDRVLGKEAEFLAETPDINGMEKLRELEKLAASFGEQFDILKKSFDEENIDWNAHNMLAQTITPLKSKAGLMRLDILSDLLWEIESLFQSIRFDDVEKNRPSVDKLAVFVERLSEEVRKALKSL